MMNEQQMAAGLGKPDPCVYCEGASVALLTLTKATGEKLWAATCQTCQAAGPMALGPVQALTLWNHRPLVQKLKREVREWRAAAEEGAENGGVWSV